MSIQTELNQLSKTKKENRAAILDRGVKVSDEPYAQYPSKILAITQTAGTYDSMLQSLIEKNIVNFTVPDGTREIIHGQSGNTSLQTLVIPGSVKRISGGSFQDCTNLTSVTLGEGIEYLAGFSGCTSLTSLTIPDSVINVSTLSGLTGLTSLTIGSGAKRYAQYCFNNLNTNCHVNLTDLKGWCESDFESNPLGITKRLYMNNVEVTDLVIPDTVTYINGFAFYYCSSLTSVTIPSSVTSIRGSAFENCRGLNSITLNSTTPPTIGADVFTYTNNCPIYVTAQSVDAYKTAWTTYASRIQAIPVESFAFRFTPSNGDPVIEVELEDLTTPGVIAYDDVPLSVRTGTGSLEIGNGVTEIADTKWENAIAGPFSQCTGITSVTLKEGLVKIGDLAFYGCSNIKNLVFPSTLTTIGELAFDDCTSVGGYNFKSSVPPALVDSNGAYYNFGWDTAYRSSTGLRFGCGFFVPSGSLSAYQNATGWTDYANILYDDSQPFISYDCIKAEYDENTGLKTGSAIISGIDSNYHSSTFGQSATVTMQNAFTAGESQTFRQITSKKIRPYDENNPAKCLIVAKKVDYSMTASNPSGRGTSITISNGSVAYDGTQDIWFINQNAGEIWNSNGWLYDNSGTPALSQTATQIASISKKESSDYYSIIGSSGGKSLAKSIKFEPFRFNSSDGSTIRLFQLF